MPAKQLLIDTAIKLFSANGYHATGIDLILKESGVAKKTLYTHFKSKNDLILAAMQQYDATWGASFKKDLSRLSPSPRKRLEGIFTLAEKWFRRPYFNGCLFMTASLEFPNGNDPIRKYCKKAKQDFCSFIEKLARDAEIPRPKALAKRLAIVFEGAIILAHIESDPKIARSALGAGKVLIEEAFSR